MSVNVATYSITLFIILSPILLTTLFIDLELETNLTSRNVQVYHDPYNSILPVYFDKRIDKFCGGQPQCLALMRHYNLPLNHL